MTRPKIYDLAALDALPVGSVIMEGPTGKPQPWVGNIDVMPGVFHRFPDGWYVVAGTGPHLPDFGFGPLTVLHIPRGKPCVVESDALIDEMGGERHEPS